MFIGSQCLIARDRISHHLKEDIMTNTIVSTAGFALLALVSTSAAALAHATLQTAEVQNDSTYRAVLKVPHGCDGKATNEVRIKLPEGFISAQPMPKAGWETEIIKGDYAKTYSNHGKDVSSGAVEIRWKGGDLPDDFFDEFVVQGKVTGFDKDTTIYFPATQLCGADATVVWDQIPAEGQDPHSLKSPAPQVKVVLAGAGEHDGHGAAHGDHGAASAIKASDLELKEFYTKAMLPGARVGGGYVSITNTGKEADRLIGGTTPVAGRLEIHEMAMEGDVMKMRQLTEGVEIPAGETLELKPGGFHLMFQDIKEPFKEGQSLPVTLEFEKAGKVELVFPVVSAKGKAGAAAGEHQHQ